MTIPPANVPLQENPNVVQFLQGRFPEGFEPQQITPQEQAVIDVILARVSSEFNARKYVLGLAMDFILLAESLSFLNTDQDDFTDTLTQQDLFQTYTHVTHYTSGKGASALQLKFGDDVRGIRDVEDDVIVLFHGLGRSNYPSSAPYTTGVWDKEQNLLVEAFKLSESGRYHAVMKLIELGMSLLKENTFFGRNTPRIRLYPLIVGTYDRSARTKTENGGLVFQGIAYGYCKSDRPHLDLIVDKVRTGSARQKRFGDIDGYYGLDLELSVEVKDLAITEHNIEKQLGHFLTEVAGNNITGIAFGHSFNDAAEEILEVAGVFALSQDELLWMVEGWDWQKQDRAAQGVLHYLSHVEQNPDATNRLLEFIKEHDPRHPSLDFLTSEEEEAEDAVEATEASEGDLIDDHDLLAFLDEADLT